ncbi:hypothetical protein J4425_02085 [Candidatus Woesearchaeota archaeon]|nr:hypothetical protein [Candidatus Woesearchaeota archaeon]
MIKTTRILIPKNVYIGIDESNHGKFPEVYVSVLSTNPEGIIPKRLQKIRSRVRLEKIIKELEDFKYTIVERNNSDYFEKNGVRAQAISTLLLNFEIIPSRTFVYIDGEDIKGVAQDILTIYNSKSRLNFERDHLIFAVGGDTIFPVVNDADRLAYKIFTEVQRNRNYHIKEREVKILLC